jgi:uncharacterized paraquat-inducible protein A
MGKNGETIYELLCEFDTLANKLDITQDNAHRATWLEYNEATFMKYGWWEENIDGTYSCVLCKTMTHAKYAFCPNCGASMRVRRR